MKESLLEVKDLNVSFSNNTNDVKVIRGVSFEVQKGELVGIVGESGSGKTVTSMSILRLLKENGNITDGKIVYKGENLIEKSEKEMIELRGRDIGMIFQDPSTSLNPVFTVGEQISSVIRRHEKITKREAKKRAIELLELVGIPSPEERYKNYPHEFSGGMRQRAVIAMAISSSPELLIADEPTTALDVTIQAQILKLLIELKEKREIAIILITHDLGVVANMCTKVIVMYGGLIMEEGSIEDIFYKPIHPYTKGLLLSLPKKGGKDKERLVPIKGNPPDPSQIGKGCPFANRCPYVMDICKEMPKYYVKGKHRAMCWLLNGDENYNGE